MKGRTCAAVGLLALLAGGALAQSNIDPSHSFAWSENLGWITLYPSAQYGVVVTADHLSGHAYGENAGWIWFGDGPDNGTTYTNVGTDHGVNVDPSGDLSGYAWGENIGWINFDTTSVGASQVSIDMGTGEFSGFAWSENSGWINFGDGYTQGLSYLPNTGIDDWAIYE
ncbi:hypothetical protein KQI84_13395 [bacterium]|nr:hypothetical protein [bacterium]